MTGHLRTAASRPLHGMVVRERSESTGADARFLHRLCGVTPAVPRAAVRETAAPAPAARGGGPVRRMFAPPPCARAAGTGRRAPSAPGGNRRDRRAPEWHR